MHSPVEMSMYILAYKLKRLGQFCALKVGGRLMCRSENVPLAVAAVISRVSCVDSRWLVVGQSTLPESVSVCQM